MRKRRNIGSVASLWSIGSTAAILRVDPIAQQQDVSSSLRILADPTKGLAMNDVLNDFDNIESQQGCSPSGTHQR